MRSTGVERDTKVQQEQGLINAKLLDHIKPSGFHHSGQGGQAD